VVTPSVSSSKESLESFAMVHQVTHSVSSFSECLKKILSFLHISVSPNDVISLAVFDVRPLENPYISFSIFRSYTQ